MGRAEQAAHPTVHFHFTPTYSLWLNQVERWFAQIERDVIARGVLTSLPDLRKNFSAASNSTNTTGRPFTWTYNNPKHRLHPANLRCSPLESGPPTGDEVPDDRNDRDHEKNMNQPTCNREDKQPERPQDEENQCNYQEHVTLAGDEWIMTRS